MKLKVTQLQRNLKWVQLHLESQNALISDERIGPILGQHGLNAAKFCLEYNERSFFVDIGVPLCIYLYFNTEQVNKSFTFFIGPITNYLLFHSLLFSAFCVLKHKDLDLVFFYKFLLSLGINTINFNQFFYFIKSKLFGLF